MIKLKIAIVFITLLIFNFQNCSVDKNSKWSASQSVVSGTTTTIAGVTSSTSVVKFSSQSIAKVNFFDSVSDVRPNGKVNNLAMQYIFDLSNGRVQQFDSAEQFVKEFCLTESLMNELQSILYTSNVCKNLEPLPDGVVCAEVFKMPYAEIITNNEVYPLGSASNACGSHAIDLCGDAPQKLKDWFAFVKNQSEQLMCQ